MESSGKYAKLEYERRFLLDRLPEGVSDPVRIRDRYLHGTRLRLHAVETLDGEVLQQKLGQRTRPRQDNPRHIAHPGLFLDEQEFSLLSTLPGDDLVKVRYRHDLIPGAVVDDVESPRDDLVLLQVSFPDPVSMELFRPPSGTGAEVGDDEAYTGSGLARPD